MAYLIGRSVDTAYELGRVAALHVRRAAGVLADAAGKIGTEVDGMLWSCRDVVATTWRPDRDTNEAPRVVNPAGLLHSNWTPRPTAMGNPGNQYSN